MCIILLATWSDFQAAVAWCTVTKRQQPHGGPGIEQDLLLVFRASTAWCSGRRAPHNRRTRYTANFTSTCYWRRRRRRIYGGSILLLFSVFCNAPNFAVNYGRAFFARGNVSPLKYSTIGPLTPPMHFYAADYLFPPSLALAEFSVTRSSLASHRGIIIRDTNRRGRPFYGYIYCVIICSCTFPFIYGATFSTFPLCYFNERGTGTSVAWDEV